MDKLLLTSAGFENPKVAKKFLKLVGKPASKIKIIFVPTASRTKEELFYVGKSKKELLNLGIPNRNIKILNLDHKILYKKVDGSDVIYVCGGNTFYLLKKIRETDFDKIIKQFIKDGKLYLGVSAGSIIVGPNIKIASLGDKNKYKLKNFTGLNLIDMAILPHFCEKDKQIIEKFRKKVNYPVVPITDNQAILILGKKTKTIGD